MLKSLGVLASAAALAGCASMNKLSNDVSTFGSWPPGRPPGAYVFDRLPSQQLHPEMRTIIENAAGGALAAHGFRIVADPSEADDLIQVGARVIDRNPWVYNGPLFAGGYYGPWGPRPFWGPGWGWGGPYAYPFDMPNFDREVVVVIRDRRSSQLLYEAHATNNGPSPSIGYLLPAMFSAALQGFPAADPQAHDVTLPISNPVQEAPGPAVPASSASAPA